MSWWYIWFHWRNLRASTNNTPQPMSFWCSSQMEVISWMLTSIPKHRPYHNWYTTHACITSSLYVWSTHFPTINCSIYPIPTRRTPGHLSMTIKWTAIMSRYDNQSGYVLARHCPKVAMTSHKYLWVGPYQSVQCWQAAKSNPLGPFNPLSLVVDRCPDISLGGHAYKKLLHTLLHLLSLYLRLLPMVHGLFIFLWGIKLPVLPEIHPMLYEAADALGDHLPLLIMEDNYWKKLPQVPSVLNNVSCEPGKDI